MTRHQFVQCFVVMMMILCMVLALATRGNSPNLLTVGYLFGMTMFGGIALGMEIGKDLK